MNLLGYGSMFDIGWTLGIVDAGAIPRGGSRPWRCRRRWAGGRRG